MIVPFADVSREYKSISNEINESIERVLKSGWFILGKEVEHFESKLAEYIGTTYAVGCANGTDAITLTLLALEIGDGDEVITQTNTCIPTICGIVNANAKPVLCDIYENDLMINTERITEKITSKTKAILPVNLYGAAAGYTSLNKITQDYGIPSIEDCAQSIGSQYNNQKTGSFGIMGCFSFYPSKNLGCYGDGGAITTNNYELYKKLLMLRNYGQEKRYYHSTFGLNSRLDEIQAAILSEKLNYLDIWNSARKKIAGLYDNAFNNNENVIPLSFDKGVESVYHLYIVKVNNREKLQVYLTSKNISTLIHYPIPCHLQKAYEYLGYKQNDFPVAERASKSILSLPVFPQMEESEVEYVIKSINDFYQAG